MRALLTIASMSLLFTACGKNRVKPPKPVDTEELAEKSRKGYPDWITNPYTKGFDPGNSICASAQSTMGLGSGNIDAARSRLADVDVALESTNLAKQNILVQSAAAMLSQANASQNVALQLLG